VKKELRDLEEYRRQKREAAEPVLTPQELAQIQARKQKERETIKNTKVADDAKHGRVVHKQQAVFGGASKRPVRKKAKLADTASTPAASAAAANAPSSSPPPLSTSSIFMDIDADDDAHAASAQVLHTRTDLDALADYNLLDPARVARDEVRALYQFPFDLSALQRGASNGSRARMAPRSLATGVMGVLRNSSYTQDPVLRDSRAEVWSLQRYTEHLDSLAGM
jgi:hypothetical protein